MSRGLMGDLVLPPQIEAVLRDPATSNWLHYAVLQMLARDPIDALHDAEVLLTCAKAQADAALTAAGGPPS